MPGMETETLTSPRPSLLVSYPALISGRATPDLDLSSPIPPNPPSCLTGRPETPSRDYWRNCMRRIKLGPEQREFARTAMGEITLLRARLASRLM